MKPENCRGTTAAELAACGGKGAHSNPGSNIELNAIVATLSTGPVSLADKARETNVTIVRRCARMDGRILQPDKPATAVDSMLAPPAWATLPAANPSFFDRCRDTRDCAHRVGSRCPTNAAQCSSLWHSWL